MALITDASKYARWPACSVRNAMQTIADDKRHPNDVCAAMPIHTIHAEIARVAGSDIRNVSSHGVILRCRMVCYDFKTCHS